MGLNLLKRSSVLLEYTPEEDTTPNPNKYNFEIEKFHDAGKYLVLLVHYPHCTTFGGNKVLVLNGYKSYQEISNLDELDPHFLESNNVVMRFRGDAFTDACNIVDLIVAAEFLKDGLC